MKPARGSDPVRPFCHAGEGYPCADCPRIGAPAGAGEALHGPRLRGMAGGAIMRPEAGSGRVRARGRHGRLIAGAMAADSANAGISGMNGEHRQRPWRCDRR